MKCLFVVAFLALVATSLAVPVDVPAADVAAAAEKVAEPVKAEDAKDARDKRGVFVTSYATAPIAAAPVAYSAYPALSPVAPVAYTSGLPAAVAHTSYVHSYPTAYVSSYPHSSYIVA